MGSSSRAKLVIAYGLFIFIMLTMYNLFLIRYVEQPYLWYISIVMTIFVTLGTCLFSLKIFTIVTSPWQKVRNAMEVLGEGDFSIRVDDDGNEINDIVNVFNNMAENLQNKDSFRKNYLVDATHEIKNPITSIKVLSESLLSSDSNDITLFKEFVQDINTEADRLIFILQNLLQLYALDFEYKSVVETVNIRQYIIEVLKNIAIVAKSKSIDIIYEIEQDILWSVRKKNFHYILINLVDNSIKYSSPDTVIRISAYVKDNILILQVEDQGIGIQKEHIPYVTDNFYRANCDNSVGSGLGLAVVKRLTEHHNGHIEIKSVMGEGTIVIIYLPQIIE